MLRIVLFLVTLLSASAHAALGWHDRHGNCYAVPLEAAQASCTQMAWPVASGLNYCREVLSINSCNGGTPASNWDRCLVNFSLYYVNYADGVVTQRTHNAVIMACTLTDTPGLTSTKVQDYMSLWALFVLAGVMVLCAKSIYNRFRIDHAE